MAKSEETPDHPPRVAPDPNYKPPLETESIDDPNMLPPDPEQDAGQQDTDAGRKDAPRKEVVLYARKKTSPLVFMRWKGSEAIVVAINPSAEKIPPPSNFQRGGATTTRSSSSATNMPGKPKAGTTPSPFCRDPAGSA